jgi:Arc/MetJ-type ribon-helix-helix transcriptional regulator
MATNIHVRLDDETERQLNELVDHFQAVIKGTKASQVVRAAIMLLHEEKLGKATTVGRK